MAASEPKESPANNPGLHATRDEATKGYFMQQTVSFSFFFFNSYFVILLVIVISAGIILNFESFVSVADV